MATYKQPVKVGEEIIVDILNIGEKKDGIARIKNFVIIVPKGILEKKYKIQIKKVFENFAISEIVNEVK